MLLNIVASRFWLAREDGDRRRRDMRAVLIRCGRNRGSCDFRVDTGHHLLDLERNGRQLGDRRAGVRADCHRRVRVIRVSEGGGQCGFSKITVLSD